MSMARKNKQVESMSKDVELDKVRNEMVAACEHYAAAAATLAVAYERQGAVHGAPTFSHVELLIIADAVTQYSENRDGAEADGREEEASALRDKLDAYVASLAE